MLFLLIFKNMKIYIKYSGFKMPSLRNSRNWAKVGLTKSESDLKKWHFVICAHCTQNFHSHRFCTRITGLMRLPIISKTRGHNSNLYTVLKSSGPQLSISIKSFSDWPLVWKLWSKKHEICLVVFRFSALSLGFIFGGGLTRLTIISEKGVIAQTSWQFWKAEYLSLPEV